MTDRQTVARREARHPEPTAEDTSRGDLRLMQGLLDMLPAMAAYWDIDRRNVIANAAFIDWFGRTPEEMRGMSIPEAIGETVYQLNLPHIEAAYAGEEQFFDRTLTKTDGETRHVQFHYLPDLVDGVVQGIFVLASDTTPRIEAESLVDETQRLAHLGSWSWELDTGAMVWSEETYKIFGVRPETFTPRRELVLQMIHPQDIDAAMSHAAHARVHAQDYTHRFRITRPDGEVRYIESHGHISGVENGRTVRMSGTYQDITEINSTTLRLEQIDRLNQDVIAMLGHDVRAPLTVILGYLEELEDNWASLEDNLRQTLIHRVRASARRASRLVNDILTLASAQSGAIRPSPKEVRLQHLLTETLDDLPEGRAVLLELEDPTLMMHVDPFHLRQIIANLVTNAQRYGRPPITIRSRVDGSHLSLAVIDHGDGVPEDVVPSLFEPFGASGHDQLHHRGTGLGLYLIDQLVRANGGTVGYHPPVDGGGTAFEVRLPLA